MSDRLNPDAPRRGLAAALAALLVASVATVVVATWSTPAGAAELERFGGCGELQGWLDDTARRAGMDFGAASGSGGDALATTDDASAAAPPVSAAPESATAARSAADGAGTGATNVGVEGVDELDRVDALGDGRLVVVDENGTVSLVDVAGRRVLSTLRTAGSGARLTADTDARVVWVLATVFDERSQRVRVTRLRIDGDALVAGGTWETTGRLVDARRVAGRLHVVAVDGGYPAPGQPEPAVPFRGVDDEPVVACDQVWHPTGAASSPEALLVATLDAAAGEVRPIATAEVVGGGEIVHATTGALYVATPLWDERGAGDTTIHRFALDGLRWTGSGTVPGRPLNQFALDDHEGVLRVAVTVDQPMPVEPDGGAGGPEPAVDPAVGAPDGAAASDIASSDMAISRAPVAVETDNLVVTLDTDGDLDELGRLSGLGLEAERIQGVRFAGDTAYVVTFRQTDPLYVIDLADPRRPTRRGELKIPGFSSYLHPVGDGLVLGIGRAGDEQGTITGAQAQLFDVSDQMNPRRLDAEPLGDDSEAAADHHAVGVLGGGRFALPYTTWPAAVKGDPVTIEPVPAEQPAVDLPAPAPDQPATDEPVTDQPASDQPTIGGGSGSSASPGSVGAAPPQPVEPALAVAVLRVADRALGRDLTLSITGPDGRGPAAWQGTRTLAVDGGFAVVVVGAGIALHDDAGARVGWIALPATAG